LFFAVAIPISVGTGNYKDNFTGNFIDALIYAVFTFVVTYIIVYQLFPRFLPKKKIFLLFLSVIGVMIVFGLLELHAYRLAVGKGLLKVDLLNLITWSISSSTENVGILVGILLGKKFYEAQLELEKREIQKRENELRLLKSQIDPHFLFNNLNTVDSLIDKDPKIAKEYLNHLSKLYRYLISTKDDDVVTVADELGFAENYMYLIEKRFGRAYQFSILNNTAAHDKFIPPGALQTVLENVVKHNAASEDEPIITDIVLDAHQIAITNNVKPNFKAQETTGTGLQNLKSRYLLLTDKNIEIINSDRYQIVLPLIKAVS